MTENTWRAAINEEGIVASAFMSKDVNASKTTIHRVFSSIHTGDVSYNVLLFLYVDFYHILSIEPTVPPPVTVVLQAPSRLVTEAAIAFSVPSTSFATSILILLFFFKLIFHSHSTVHYRSIRKKECNNPQRDM